MLFPLSIEQMSAHAFLPPTLATLLRPLQLRLEFIIGLLSACLSLHSAEPYFIPMFACFLPSCAWSIKHALAVALFHLSTPSSLWSRWLSWWNSKDRELTESCKHDNGWTGDISQSTKMCLYEDDWPGSTSVVLSWRLRSSSRVAFSIVLSLFVNYNYLICKNVV